MTPLEWINLTGNTLTFIGTIIFSIEFIKSKEQISDETKTYIGGNKYLENASTSSRPFYIIAFVMIISGFGLNISSQFSELFSQDIQLQLALIISFIFCALSIVITEQVYLSNQASHQKRKAHLKWEIYLSTLKSIPDRYENKEYGIIGKYNEEQLFELYRDGDIKNIQKREQDLLGIRGELIDIDELKSTKNAKDYIETIKKFLKS